MHPKVALYASVGETLTRYDLDIESATLARQESVSLPENVQYAWPHANRRTLYVATSNSATGMGAVGTSHHLVAFAIDPVTGGLTEHGPRIRLPDRPIHMATDIPSRHVLAAFSNPAGLRIYRISDDGTLAAEVPRPASIDVGIYPHQVRATLDNRQVILVSRGHSAAAGNPEEPGALEVFDYHDGVLGREVIVAPNGGYGFGPRHLDFHPTQPWIYVSLERQNALAHFTMRNGLVAPEPLSVVPTLADPDNVRPRQLGGTVHVHPNGRFVYAVNRASGVTEHNGQKVFAGGENNFAVYAIDPSTGAPSLIEHAETHGIHCRTFHIDPSGKVLVAAHIMDLPVRRGDTTEVIPARLSLFRIAADGRLGFVRAYDVQVGDKSMWWMGLVTL